MSGMSEPAIRNYELGNRQPNQKQLQKIAGTLELSPFALSDPDIESYHSLMHMLFATEDMHGIKPIEKDNQVFLTAENKNPISSDVAQRLQEWNRELTTLKNSEITQENTISDSIAIRR
jgi:transcriptional regulator with XRE-family HTH domain